MTGWAENDRETRQMTERLILGQILRLDADPARSGPGAVAHERRGALHIKDGLIAGIGTAQALRAAHPALPVDDHGAHLIIPGFVDAHAHYPQTAIIASWGKRLIDWLETYTFPEEMRFSDPAYAAEVAGRYLDLLLANGTTTVCSYCTIHPQSVDAFFTAAEARGMRVLAGKTCMDRDTAPEGLRDTAGSAYDDSKALLSRWHGRGRLSYVITPRFSPTSTEAQLDALGALWAEHPDCLMQTHISEQTDEIAWVKSLYPNARDYLDTYEAHGLLGPNGLYGHAIHLERREIDRLSEVGAALVHCPTSNTFIGSGLFDMGSAPGCASGSPPTPAAGRPSRCCAPWPPPTRSRNSGAPRCTRPSFCGWPPARRPRRSASVTGSAASRRASRPTSPCSISSPPPP